MLDSVEVYVADIGAKGKDQHALERRTDCLRQLKIVGVKMSEKNTRDNNDSDPEAEIHIRYTRPRRSLSDKPPSPNSSSAIRGSLLTFLAGGGSSGSWG